MFKLNLIERLKYISKKGDPKEVGGMLYSFASVAIAILAFLMFGLIISMLVLLMVLPIDNGFDIRQFQVLGIMALLILTILLSLGEPNTIGDKNAT